MKYLSNAIYIAASKWVSRAGRGEKLLMVFDLTILMQTVNTPN